MKWTLWRQIYQSFTTQCQTDQNSLISFTYFEENKELHQNLKLLCTSYWNKNKKNEKNENLNNENLNKACFQPKHHWTLWLFKQRRGVLLMKSVILAFLYFPNVVMLHWPTECKHCLACGLYVIYIYIPCTHSSVCCIQLANQRSIDNKVQSFYYFVTFQPQINEKPSSK